MCQGAGGVSSVRPMIFCFRSVRPGRAGIFYSGSGRAPTLASFVIITGD
jgi:hypothetical protein